MKFSAKTGANKSLKDFIGGYFYGYDWLIDLWNEYVSDESGDSTTLGATTLLAIQISRWPEVLEESDIPDLIGDSIDRPAELLSFWAKLLTTVGQLGLKLSRAELAANKTQPIVNPQKNIGRNDPCPCGSGKKYKKCCLS